jgi:hypothetical protein
VGSRGGHEHGVAAATALAAVVLLRRIRPAVEDGSESSCAKADAKAAVCTA